MVEAGIDPGKALKTAELYIFGYNIEPESVTA
jgi:hypothetical protein